MYLLAPTAVVSSAAVAATSLPSYMFEPGPFSLLARIGTFAYKGATFAAVGFAAGLAGTTISKGLIALRKMLDSEFETPNKPPPTVLNATTWALHMGLSSNLRYQTLNGLESVMEKAVSPGAFRTSVVVLRCLNNVLGGMSFVMLARLTGSQKVEAVLEEKMEEKEGLMGDRVVVGTEASEDGETELQIKESQRNDQATIQKLIQQLHSQFQLKQLGDVSLFLGIQVTRTTQGYFLHQNHYANKLLQIAGFTECKHAPTPLPLKTKSSPTTDQPYNDPQLYRKLAGSLQYLSITRPDIAFATNFVCQHMHEPQVIHFQALKRLLRYIKGTSNFGLPITPGDFSLRTYVDADWAADTHDRKSVSGFCTFLGPNLISWSVKKQVTVARSSTEAEYRALASATSDVLWLRRLVAELHLPQQSSTTIHCDNTSAIALAHNPVFHSRTKHIEIDYHFIREHLNSGAISIVHLSSQDQIADILTKTLPTARFNDIRNKLTIHPMNA